LFLPERHFQGKHPVYIFFKFYFILFQFFGFESLVTSPPKKEHFSGRIYTLKNEHFQKFPIFFVTKWQKFAKFSLNH
jgi:hypothetical protein